MSTERTPVSLLNKRGKKQGRKQGSKRTSLLFEYSSCRTVIRTKGPGGGLKKFKIPILAARRQSLAELVFT